MLSFIDVVLLMSLLSVVVIAVIDVVAVVVVTRSRHLRKLCFYYSESIGFEKSKKVKSEIAIPSSVFCKPTLKKRREKHRPP